MNRSAACKVSSNTDLDRFIPYCITDVAARHYQYLTFWACASVKHLLKGETVWGIFPQWQQNSTLSVSLNTFICPVKLPSFIASENVKFSSVSTWDATYPTFSHAYWSWHTEQLKNVRKASQTEETSHHSLRCCPYQKGEPIHVQLFLWDMLPCNTKS